MTRWLALFLALPLAPGCAAVQQATQGIRDRIVGAVIQEDSRDQLETVAVQVSVIRNLYGPEVRSTDANYVGSDWQAGRNLALLHFTSRDSPQFVTVDGSVKVDGQPLEHKIAGIYYTVFDGDEPRRIELETTTGDAVAFSVAPAPPVRITAINGGPPAGATVDMSQPLVLDIENPPGSEGSFLRINFPTDAVGTRYFNELAVLPSADRIEIPAEAWGGSWSSGKFPTKGDSFIQVERFTLGERSASAIGAAQLISAAWDTQPIVITGDPGKDFLGINVNEGIAVSGELKADDKSTVAYTVSRPNAHLGRPFTSGTRFALVSFVVRATGLKDEGQINTAGYSAWWKTQFPVLPDSEWEALVARLHDDVVPIMEQELGYEILPVETAMAAPSYANLPRTTDRVTEVVVEKGYRGSRGAFPTEMMDVIDATTFTYAADKPSHRLIEELDVDGLIAVTVDLRMDLSDDKKGALNPAMSFRILGPAKGYKAGPTVYAVGNLTGDGVEFEEAKERVNSDNRGSEFLSEVMNHDLLVQGFRASLQAMKAEEAEHAYYAKLWPAPTARSVANSGEASGTAAGGPTTDEGG